MTENISVSALEVEINEGNEKNRFFIRGTSSFFNNDACTTISSNVSIKNRSLFADSSKNIFKEIDSFFSGRVNVDDSNLYKID
jgi:hypothetical protein